jgi:TRAP-type transport system periplasmic protein
VRAALAAALALASAGVAATPTTARAAETHVLKIASLAPEGSAWMNLFHDWARAVEQRTGGTVKLKFYAGGVAGDERDFVRKMRLGQLSGAAITSIGLGLIQPEVRVLEVPMLINDYAELDYVRGKLADELRARFADKGFVLLAWGDVGPIHLFSNTPVRARADLAKTKLWEWSDDPVSRAMFKQLGITGVPLGVPDVLPGLSTGMIDAAFGSPLAVLALQWHGKLRYMTSMSFGQAIGATVVSRAQFEKLTPDEQKILLEEARTLEQRVLAQIRGENDRALEAIKRTGLTVVETPPALGRELAAAALPLRAALEGALYSAPMRAKVEKLVAEYRATHVARR